MKPTFFAIDGNFYLHRIYHTTQYETADRGRAIAYNFLSRVCQDALAVRASQVIVCFDGAEVFRYAIYEGYKGTRSEHSDVYSYLPAVKALLKAAGIPVLHPRRYEADDLLCTLASRFQKTHNVVIGSRDKDAYQYLRPGVRLYDSAFRIGKVLKPRFVSHEDVPDLMGIPCDLARVYQCLVGDKIDNVTQVVSPAKARKGLLKWGSVKEWARNDAEMRKVFIENKAQLELNMKLVTLVSDIKIPDSIDLTFKRSTATHFPKIYYAFADAAKPKSKGLF